MKKTVIIRSEELKKRACQIITYLPDDGPVHEVVIREHKKNRSLDQNALYWKWVTIMANELGHTKDEYHEMCKERHLVPILKATDEEFCEMVEAVNRVYLEGMKREALELKKQIVRLCSTSRLNTAQMSEYMTEIQREAAGLGIALPHPEEPTLPGG